MKALWNEYDRKLETALQLNRQQAYTITRMKVYSLLQSVKPVKILAVITGILWVLLVDSIIVRTWAFASPFFLVSAIVQVLLTKLAIGIYVYQLVLIHQAQLNAPVLTTQRRLAALQTATLWVPKLLFLQMPVWTTFYWNSGMLLHGNLVLWIIQGLTTLAFTLAGVWLFLHITPENRHKKWFRLLFAGKEWDGVREAMDLLSETEGA
ncbi:hypothetical protein FLA_0059 [Filimonas lacunae]|nr:hypothetical protein FLA_0059 [Filimonas lacunae]